MITGVRTTALGTEVVQAFVAGDEHRLMPKVSHRDVVLMATCRRPHFTKWIVIQRQLPKADPRQLNTIASKLEKLGLVELDRPPLEEKPDHRTKFGFDKDGKHKWV